MRHLTLGEVVELHFRIIRLTGGAHGLRDLNGLESALAQPKATFEGRDLYATLNEKVAALGFSLIWNHPFVDGNKRVAHAAMETLLLLNGREIEAPVDEQEALMTELAAGQIERDQLQARVGLRARRAHRDAEGTPRSNPSALRSSSTSGQWIPAPSPRSSKRARCSGVALRRRGNQARGVARRRPSARTTTSSSSVTVTSLIRGSTLGIEKAMPCLLELVSSFLDDALDPTELNRREPRSGC